MDKKNEILVSRLQDSLASLRIVAGWSAERLSQELDVTRQTIVNLETGKTKMSKIQYLAIRSVFETETNTKNKEVLLQLMDVMVDSDIPDENRRKLKETISNAAQKKGKRLGIIGASVAAIFALAAAPCTPALSAAIAMWYAAKALTNETDSNNEKVFTTKAQKIIEEGNK